MVLENGSYHPEKGSAENQSNMLNIIHICHGSGSCNQGHGIGMIESVIMSQDTSILPIAGPLSMIGLLI